MKRLIGIAVLLSGCAQESLIPEELEARSRAYYSEHLDEARDMIDLCERVEASDMPLSDYPVTFTKNCSAARIAVARSK